MKQFVPPFPASYFPLERNTVHEYVTLALIHLKKWNKLARMFIIEIAAFIFPNYCNSTSNIKFGFFLEFLNLKFAYQEQKAAHASDQRQLRAFLVDLHEPVRKVQPQKASCPCCLLLVRSLALLLAAPSRSFLDKCNRAGSSTQRWGHKPAYWSPFLFCSQSRPSPRFLSWRISQRAKKCWGSDLVPHLSQIFIKVARLVSLMPSVFPKRGKRCAVRVCSRCVSTLARLPFSLFRPPGIAPL